MVCKDVLGGWGLVSSEKIAGRQFSKGAFST